MFISVQFLENDLGVDPRIGRFFVDRKVPENNSYWEKRLLYISFGTGYMFIPIFYDILFRLGIPVEILLEENRIQLMEKILHYSALHERNLIDKTDELLSIRQLFKDRMQNEKDFDHINMYLDQSILRPLNEYGTPFPPLNRADNFLYVLFNLTLSEYQHRNALHFWYCLLPIFLLMDDIRDFYDDRVTGEQNVVVDLGAEQGGFEKAFKILFEKAEILEKMNPKLAMFLKNGEVSLRRLIPVIT